MAEPVVKSNLEWLASLSPINAAVPTDETKFLRKVRLSSFIHASVFLGFGSLGVADLDRDHRHNRYALSSVTACSRGKTYS